MVGNIGVVSASQYIVDRKEARESKCKQLRQAIVQ